MGTTPRSVNLGPLEIDLEMEMSALDGKVNRAARIFITLKNLRFFVCHHSSTVALQGQAWVRSKEACQAFGSTIFGSARESRISLALLSIKRDIVRFGLSQVKYIYYFTVAPYY